MIRWVKRKLGLARYVYQCPRCNVLFESRKVVNTYCPECPKRTIRPVLQFIREE